MLGGNLDGGQHVVAGGRDDDADGIDLVVRGVSAVEHAGDGVEADLAGDAALQVVLERRGGKRECAVRSGPFAVGPNFADAGLTGDTGGHLDIVLSRDRWSNETPENWRKRGVGPAPECSTDDPHLNAEPHPQRSL